MSALGSKADLTDPKFDFRFTPDYGHAATSTACPKSADFVAKVESCIGPNFW